MVTKRCRAICAQAFSSSAVVVINCMLYGKITRRLLMATILFAADAAHVDELPGRGQRADRHLDQRRLARGEGLAQRRAEVLWRARPAAGGAEALRVFDEIGIGKVRGDQPIAEALLLDA